MDEAPAIPRRQSADTEFSAEEQIGISPVPIGRGRTEAQIAADYRAKVLPLLEQLANIITEARKDHGMTIGFAFNAPDAFGRSSIAMLEISKKLC